MQFLICSLTQFVKHNIFPVLNSFYSFNKEKNANLLDICDFLMPFIIDLCKIGKYSLPDILGLSKFHLNGFCLNFNFSKNSANESRLMNILGDDFHLILFRYLNVIGKLDLADTSNNNNNLQIFAYFFNDKSVRIRVLGLILLNSFITFNLLCLESNLTGRDDGDDDDEVNDDKALSISIVKQLVDLLWNRLNDESFEVRKLAMRVLINFIEIGLIKVSEYEYFLQKYSCLLVFD